MQPLVFLALFAPLLPDMGPTTSALQWFVPGIVAMSCLMGSSMVGASLMQEMFTGSHERLLVSPLSRTVAAGRPGAARDRADAGPDVR